MFKRERHHCYDELPSMSITLLHLLPLFFSFSVFTSRIITNTVSTNKIHQLGAFGFLAGTTMETHALPNAGLHDQRAALHWIQNYIALVGGDPSNVSAWGQSAGGGSIMHHLVAHGGTLDPLFRRAVILSPGFGPAIDRHGAIEEEFRSFATAAGCATEDNDVMTCLRNANISLLKDANENAIIGGPAPDGWFIRQAVSVEYSQGLC